MPVQQENGVAATKPGTFEYLSDDALSTILNNLSPRDILNVALSRRLNSRLQNLMNAPSFWNNYLQDGDKTEEPNKAKQHFLNYPKMRIPKFRTIDQKGKKWVLTKCIRVFIMMMMM